jgi:hypothetical protein
MIVIYVFVTTLTRAMHSARERVSIFWGQQLEPSWPRYNIVFLWSWQVFEVLYIVRSPRSTDVERACWTSACKQSTACKFQGNHKTLIDGLMTWWGDCFEERASSWRSKQLDRPAGLVEGLIKTHIWHKPTVFPTLSCVSVRLVVLYPCCKNNVKLLTIEMFLILILFFLADSKTACHCLNSQNTSTDWIAKRWAMYLRPFLSFLPYSFHLIVTPLPFPFSRSSSAINRAFRVGILFLLFYCIFFCAQISNCHATRLVILIRLLFLLSFPPLI